MDKKRPIRILHFSDFHLNGEKIKDAKHVLDYMLRCLEGINREKQIDLVIFTGDMLEQGGVGYDNNLKQGFEAFLSEVISPILKALNLPKDRFIFTPGNHDVNRKSDKKSLDEYCINHSKDSNEIVELLKDDELSELKKFDDFKSFEKEYYKDCTDLTYGGDKFTATFKLEIEGYSIGISSLNSIWQCGQVPGMPTMGISQITELTKHLDNKDLKIAISHFPYYKLEKEWQDIERLLSKEFDIYFSGHTHSGLNRFIGATKDDFFLDINTEGTLAANTYENDAKYKNAFQIIDCFPQEKYQIQRYFQIHSQEFELDRNDKYAPNGILEFRIPKDHAELERIYNETLKEHEKQKKFIFKSNINPFIPFEDFFNRPNNKILEGDFIPIDKFSQMQEKLISGTEKVIRLMALSGMGKTRLVAEAFRNHTDNVYYSRMGDCEKGLVYLLENIQSPILIIDNCEISKLKEINKIISEYEKDIRIISIYNVPTNKEKGSGLGLYELGYEDTEYVVDKMIERDPLVNSNGIIKDIVKKQSGNIPLMAKLLIDAYNKTGTLNIEDPDSALVYLIEGSETQNQYKLEVLRAISLFDPLGYDDAIKDEFEFVLNNEKIHRINNDQQIIKTAFINTIEDFEKRELIEHSGGCLRIRPIPLAEWLASQWIQQNGSHFSDIFLQIQQQPKELSNRLADALKRRFEGMVYNNYAKQLFDIINDPKGGSFHDERIAFSETGSRLFLSMGTVSPVAVSKNICGLLENHEHDIYWLKENVSEIVRRNMVYTLERINSADAFPYVAKSLLILASAENETYSNNSTGQFTQLFHCFLSGTMALLSVRFQVLENVKYDPLYFPIIIKAIDAAFKSRDFIRFETAGGILESAEPIDYQPTPAEIKDYWNNCANLLIFISDQTSYFDEAIKEVTNHHVSDFYRWNNGNILDKLLSHFGSKCNYDWPEIRKTLNYYIKRWSGNDETNKQKALEWHNRFSPKSYLNRVKDAIDNRYVEGMKDFNQFYNDMYELMEPFAKEFVEKKIYQTDEMTLILKDWKFQSHWLVQQIVKEINGSFEIINEILNYAFNFIRREKVAFESPFITQLCTELLRERNEDVIKIEKRFQKQLYDNNYCRLSASIEGIIDNRQHSLLAKAINDVKSGKYDNYCINNYLHRYTWHYELDNILYTTKELLDAGINKEEVVFPYFTNGIMICNVKKIKDDAILSKIEEILLSYSYSGQFYNTACQITGLMCDILELYDRPQFALKVHKKIVEILSNNKKLTNNPFDKIYTILLPKYQNTILNQLCEDLAAEDRRFIFYWKIQFELGSSFGYGVGPLFKCDYTLLKNACKKFSHTLPSRMARMCPVEEPDKDTKETFFWWLCDTFGDNENMLSEFSANVGTYNYVGNANSSFSNYIAQKEKIFTPYINHPNKVVQDWAIKQIKSIRNTVKREKNEEEYRKMIRE